MAEQKLKDSLKGRFIVLDGPDGCGKSTQAKLLCKWLGNMGTECEFLRDPGTTDIGEKIRHLLLNPEHIAMTTETEVLLYMAARVQLWQEKIAPALKQGQVVVLDRWLSSTCAYQGYAGGFGIDRVNRIAQACLEKPWPDLTVILDVDLETASTRLKKQPDRMEQKGDGYHKKVREGFLKLTEAQQNVVVVNAAADIESVHSNVIKTVEERFA